MNNFQKFLEGGLMEKEVILDDELNPFAMRDKYNRLCGKCGKPKHQNYIIANRRGNFRHGGTTVKLRSIGLVCECADTQPSLI